MFGASTLTMATTWAFAASLLWTSGGLDDDRLLGMCARRQGANPHGKLLRELLHHIWHVLWSTMLRLAADGSLCRSRSHATLYKINSISALNVRGMQRQWRDHIFRLGEGALQTFSLGQSAQLVSVSLCMQLPRKHNAAQPQQCADWDKEGRRR